MNRKEAAERFKAQAPEIIRPSILHVMLFRTEETNSGGPHPVVHRTGYAAATPCTCILCASRPHAAERILVGISEKYQPAGTHMMGHTAAVYMVDNSSGGGFASETPRSFSRHGSSTCVTRDGMPFNATRRSTGNDVAPSQRCCCVRVRPFSS